MHFSQIVVAALSVPLCVDGNRKDEVVEDTTVASFGGMHSEDEENHLSMASMLAKAGVNPWNWIDPSMQATELRNPESEIDHASLEDDDDDDDDDFAVDIGVLSTERQLSTECESYPVLNGTGQWSNAYILSGLVYYCNSGSRYPEDCPDEYSVPLKCWNTSLMTDLSYAFYYLTEFNDDISSWDTGKVTRMRGTFKSSSFNGDISSWDTGKVTDMRATFWKASSFNGDISSWDTGKVTTLLSTFSGASIFNGDISSWDTGKVTTLLSTFSGASTFNSDMSSWDIRKVKEMSYTFSGASTFNSDISSWDTGNVTMLRGTFLDASSFNSDISSWDTGSVTTLFVTFGGASSFNSDVSSWDTGNVKKLFGTFFRASSFNVDISSWNTSNVLTMERMFYGATEFNQCLGSWASKTPDSVRTNSMFYNTSCPNQSVPDPNKGPWCQGFEERCFAACSDAEEFRFGKNDRKSCDSINDITAPTQKKLKKKIRRFCKKKVFRDEEEATSGKTIRVRDVCQESCGSRGFGPGKKCVNGSS